MLNVSSTASGEVLTRTGAVTLPRCTPKFVSPSVKPLQVNVSCAATPWSVMKSSPFCSCIPGVTGSPVWIVSVGEAGSPSLIRRSPIATLIAFEPFGRVVCSKKTFAPIETPAMPRSMRPLARSRRPAKSSVTTGEPAGPVGTSIAACEKSTTGITVVGAAESLPLLISTSISVALSVTPGTPTSAICEADAFSAK